MQSIHHEILKIAIIGCGHITRMVYTGILSQMAKEVQVVAVCDLNLQAAESMASRWFSGARVYGHAFSLLENEKPDGVIVLTTETSNAPIAKLALERGVHVYLEKPPATSCEVLADLIDTESKSTACVYTAFNRRHTPLFGKLDLPVSGIKRITGLLSRKNRTIAGFPYTSVHLIDSAQFFAHSLFSNAEVSFENNGVSKWVLRGKLEAGVDCILTFIPDAEREQEYLKLETEEETWELFFPEADGVSPKVRAIRLRNGGLEREEFSDPGKNFLEMMGYAPCLREFFDRLRHGDLAGSNHRLSYCIQTTGIMENMQKRPASCANSLSVTKA